jgi:NAD(P)-dependent dehydrogenase (short-subunit alcohol dehydrogenase family)
MNGGAVVVVGGTSGIGAEVARYYLEEGREVFVTGRDPELAAKAAADLGVRAIGLGFDLGEPASIAPGLSEVGPVSRLIVAAVLRDHNPVREFTIETALNLVIMKLVGYVETVHALLDRLSDDSSVVLFGGRAKDRPYPGSTTITTVNGGVTSLIRTLAVELAPIRFNAIHPGIVGDSPFWKERSLDHVIARTPTGKLPTTADVVDAVVFLLENKSMNGHNLYIDSGWMLM